MVVVEIDLHERQAFGELGEDDDRFSRTAGDLREVSVGHLDAPELSVGCAPPVLVPLHSHQFGDYIGE